MLKATFRSWPTFLPRAFAQSHPKSVAEAPPAIRASASILSLLWELRMIFFRMALPIVEKMALPLAPLRGRSLHCWSIEKEPN